MRTDTPSCANCKRLSGAVRVEYAPNVTEERVLCLADKWDRGSVNFLTIEHDPGAFRKRAANCTDYVPIIG